MPSLSDPDDVAREYASEAGLQARRALYEQLEGEDVKQVLVRTIIERAPERLLEVGAGSGELAAQLTAAGIGDYVAIDISPRMVELTRARRIEASLCDVQALPFPDASFDCVVAAWMLYHVPNLSLGLAEIRRVLRPGGCLVAATNGERHLAELWSLVGHERWRLRFSAENGEELLREHFEQVAARTCEAWVTLESREPARAYIEASATRAHLADRFPVLAEPLRVGVRTCVFVAR